MLSDLGLALRRLRRTPVFASIAVVSLALGIGANTAVFSLLDLVLLRSLPIREPDRLFVLHSDARAQGSATSDNHETVFSYPIYRDLRDRTTVFDGLVARSGRLASLVYGAETERGLVEIVSGNYFEVLGVHPFLGRVFTEEEDRVPDANPVAVMTHSAWVRRFAGKKSAPNTTVRINGHPFTIIGVLPPSFRGLQNGSVPDLLVPTAMHKQATPQWDLFHERRFAWLNLFARLQPGVTVAQAQAAVNVAHRQIVEQEIAQMKSPPSARARADFLNQTIVLKPATQGINEMTEWRTPLFALMGMVGLVLLIACANVANLLIARAAAREREMAIRISLGGSRALIMRECLVESLVIGIISAGFGILLAQWITTGVAAALPATMVDPGFVDFVPDARILVYTAAVSFGTVLLFGLLPAWQSGRAEITAALKTQSASVTAAAGHVRMRQAMVLVQVALATMLIALAGLFARSSSNLLSVDPGFRTANVATFSIDARLNGYDAKRGTRLYRDLVQRLRDLPGVQSAAAANPGPFTESGRSGNIAVEGYRAKEDEYTGASIRGVTPGYFATIGVGVHAGREFTDKDGADAPKVAIVNEAFRQKYFGSESLLGHRMMLGGGNKPFDIEIVGLTGDYKPGDMREKIEPAVFVPLPQDSFDAATFYVRTTAEQKSLALRIRALVRDLDSTLSIFNMKPLHVEIEEAIFRERMVSMLASCFAALATVLAALGVYGVIAYSVVRRTNEIGIRIALGALRREIVLLVFREVAFMALVGMASGVVLGLVAARLVSSQLYGIRSSDPLAFAISVAAILTVAVLASGIPAGRAAAIDPIRALRYE